MPSGPSTRLDWRWASRCCPKARPSSATGLLGQRFESLDRLAKAAKVLRGDAEGQGRLPELRDQAIAAMGLTDLRISWQRDIGVRGPVACDRPLERTRSWNTALARLSSTAWTMIASWSGCRARMGVSSIPSSTSARTADILVGYTVAGGDRRVDVWHLGRRERVFHQRTGSNAWHPDGRRLVFGPPGKDIVVWDMHKRSEVKRLRLDFHPARSVL